LTNTRRLGAIVSGPIIGLGSSSALGYGGVFVACAALTAVALVLIALVRRVTSPGGALAAPADVTVAGGPPVAR
jgi:SET family sugar efflux transporter-like MFS transporter